MGCSGTSATIKDDKKEKVPEKEVVLKCYKDFKELCMLF